jgi:hypothetical protein
MFQRSHENLAIPELPGANSPLDGSHRLFHELARYRDLQTEPWNEVHNGFVSREELGASWTTEAFNLRNGYSRDVELRQGLADLFKPEVLDERCDYFHAGNPVVSHCRRFHLLWLPQKAKGRAPPLPIIPVAEEAPIDTWGHVGSADPSGLKLNRDDVHC